MPDQDPNTPPEVVTFTPEQQAKIDEIIARNRSQIKAQQHDELTAAKAAQAKLEADLAQAQLDLNAAKNSSTKTSKDDAAHLQAQIDEFKRTGTSNQEEMARLKALLLNKEKEAIAAKEETVNVRKRNLIQAAAAEVGFISPDVVTQVTQDVLKWDDQSRQFVVVGPDGAARLNAAYEPMTVKEYYQDYAAKNPWMVRSDARPGSGSKPSSGFNGTSDGKYEIKDIFGKGSNAVLAMKLMKDNPAEYKRMKVQAQSIGLLPK